MVLKIKYLTKTSKSCLCHQTSCSILLKKVILSTLTPLGRTSEKNPVIPNVVRDLLMPWRCLARLDMTYFFGSEAKDLLNQTAHRYPKEILRFAQDDARIF